MTTTPTVKVVQAHYHSDGEKIDGEYDVLYDGQKIGRVRRNDSTPTGYWGRWNVGSWGTDTRKSAVAHVVQRHQAKLADR